MVEVYSISACSSPMTWWQGWQEVSFSPKALDLGRTPEISVSQLASGSKLCLYINRSVMMLPNMRTNAGTLPYVCLFLSHWFAEALIETTWPKCSCVDAVTNMVLIPWMICQSETDMIWSVIIWYVWYEIMLYDDRMDMIYAGKTNPAIQCNSATPDGDRTFATWVKKCSFFMFSSNVLIKVVCFLNKFWHQRSPGSGKSS